MSCLQAKSFFVPNNSKTCAELYSQILEEQYILAREMHIGYSDSQYMSARDRKSFMLIQARYVREEQKRAEEAKNAK